MKGSCKYHCYNNWCNAKQKEVKLGECERCEEYIEYIMKAQCKHSDTGLCGECFRKEIYKIIDGLKISCSVCNAFITGVDKDKIAHALPAHIPAPEKVCPICGSECGYEEFYKCPKCQGTGNLPTPKEK